MQPVQTTYSVQQATTGPDMQVHAFTYAGTQQGPTVYLQGNLHGPEIFGTVLLQRLMQELEKRQDILGTLIVVPNANPIGVQAAGYNAILGRWNLQNGTNWNRIFPMDVAWASAEECVTYCDAQLQNPNTSVEQRLAATLLKLSAPAQYVVDIHTTGAACEPHIFTHESGNTVFSDLGSPAHIVWTREDAVGAFDEASYLSYEQAATAGTYPRYACTWEAYHHSELDEAVIEERLAQLIAWLESVWSGEVLEASAPKYTYPASESRHLTTAAAGYIVWHAKVGDVVAAGQTYATAYQPWAQQTVPLVAEKGFHILGIYGAHAVSQGEQIAWVTNTPQ